jgi:hypothetical protein
MTIAAAGIGEALPCLRNKLPVVAVGLERELQDPERRGVSQFAVRFRIAKGTMILTPSPSDEFANATLGIWGAFRVLRCETFIVMVVTVDDDVGVGLIERLEERLYGEVVAVGAAGTEKRLVPIREGTSNGVCGKVRAQPFFLS